METLGIEWWMDANIVEGSFFCNSDKTLLKEQAELM
jgi:hypothetical protein